MGGPSTTWREVLGPDEAAQHEAFSEALVELQARKSKLFGHGRALHRKGLTAIRAELEVLPGLPEHAAQGLFASPARYDATIRLSNGSMDVAADKVPDIRGLAIKVHGLSGPGALGVDTDCQDWLLINFERFAFPKAEEFVAFVVAAGHGIPALICHCLRRYGLSGFSVLTAFQAKMSKPFSGFATESFHTVVPSTVGPWAARVRIVPGPGAPDANAKNDWAADVANRLRAAPITWDVQLQFYEDEATTPIEDARAGWTDAPWLSVACLTAPVQDLASPEAKAFSASVEGQTFDPWHALAAHRPLGDVMRARKAVYFATQQARKR